MPIPRLVINKPSGGLPRQPVCLRLAYLISGVSAGEFLALVGASRDEPPGWRLPVYQYARGQEPRRVRHADVSRLLESLRVDGAEPTDAALLEHLPPNLFVWSDELANAVAEAHLEWCGREEAAQAVMDLEWNPALGDHERHITACVDLNELVPEEARVRPSRREIRKQETAAKHAAVQADYRAIKQQHTGKNDKWYAHQLSRKPEYRDWAEETIRKIMKKG